MGLKVDMWISLLLAGHSGSWDLALGCTIWNIYGKELFSLWCVCWGGMDWEGFSLALFQEWVRGTDVLLEQVQLNFSFRNKVKGKKTWLWIKHVVKAGAVSCSAFLLVPSGWTLFYTPRHHGRASEEIQVPASVRAVGWSVVRLPPSSSQEVNEVLEGKAPIGL